MIIEERQSTHVYRQKRLFTKEELDYCVEGAYADGKFSSKDVAPVVKLHDNVNILELFKGPTCAFKDMALQILPYLLTVSSKKNLKDKEIVNVKITNDNRSLIFGDVVVRVNPNFKLAMHIDTDESNAGLVGFNAYGEIVK